MKTFLVLLALLVFVSLSFAQDSVPYGQPSDLKGLKKVFVDTGPDTQSRDAIIKDLEKVNLGFDIVDEIEEAEIILGFGAGRVVDRVTGVTTDSRVDIQTHASRTGSGIVIAHARGKDRVIYSFQSTQESGGPIFVRGFKRKPVTNFVREFLKIYKKANGLK